MKAWSNEKGNQTPTTASERAFSNFRFLKLIRISGYIQTWFLRCDVQTVDFYPVVDIFKNDLFIQ